MTMLKSNILSRVQNKQEREREVQQPKMNPVEEAARAFEQHQSELADFMAKNNATFERFDLLASAYNDSLSATKLAIKDYDGDLTKVYKGPFSIRKGNTTVTFDEAVLTADVKALPGVLTVNSAVLKTFEENPLLTPAQRANIAAAKQISQAAPSVVGPKEIVVNLGKK